RRIESVDGVLKIVKRWMSGVSALGASNEQFDETGIQLRITFLVGVGQSAAGNACANAEVIGLGGSGAQECFNVAQTFAVTELSKSHDVKLVKARKLSDPVVATMFANEAAKFWEREPVHKLRKNGATFVHASPSHALGG